MWRRCNIPLPPHGHLLYGPGRPPDHRSATEMPTEVPYRPMPNPTLNPNFVVGSQISPAFAPNIEPDPRSRRAPEIRVCLLREASRLSAESVVQTLCRPAERSRPEH